MRLALALGVAFTAMTAAAFAQSDRIIIRQHGGPHANVDANDDGWVSRAEASAGADRIFAELDRNDDGRLTEIDQPDLEEFNIRVPAPGEPVGGEGCQTTVDPPNAREGEERRVTVICNGADGRHERRIERHGSNEHHEDRTVTVVRTGNGGTWTSEDGTVTPVPPIPPVPPMPPMFIMMFGNSESDLNGDGAIDQAEFRAQHLRYFDAADANRDGRVRFEPPPAPPEPPAPPAPPEPPRRR